MDDGRELEGLPRNVIKFCPRCASSDFRFRQDHSFECGTCGFQFYMNAAAAVIALIEDEEGRLLLVRRAQDPAKGKLDLPGGFADQGETAEEALEREVKEELNLEVEWSRYFCSYPNNYFYGGINYSTMDLAFVCTVKDMGMIKAGDDVGGYIFLRPDDIAVDEMSFDSIRRITRDYISSRQKKAEQV
jgi:NAD+ diphosphatase